MAGWVEGGSCAKADAGEAEVGWIVENGVDGEGCAAWACDGWLEGCDVEAVLRGVGVGGADSGGEGEVRRGECDGGWSVGWDEVELHGLRSGCPDGGRGEAEIVGDFADADVGGVADVEVALLIERYAHAVAAVGADDGLGADAGVADGGCGAACGGASASDDVGVAGAAILKPDDVVGGVGDV